MEDPISIRELQVLLKSSISPQKALQHLLSCPPANTFSSEDEDPVRIFLEFMRFIMTMRPDGSIFGIWDELLHKTLKYSKNYNDSRDGQCGVLSGVSNWMIKVLGSNSCPNHYTRLELFRLARLFKLNHELSVHGDTILHTISNIKPHRLYPSGNEDDLLFGAMDLHYIIIKCQTVETIQDVVLIDLNQQLRKGNGIIVNSDETRFILNSIQLVGIFSALARYIPDANVRAKQLEFCCATFFGGICRLIDCDGEGPLVQDILNHQSFYHHVVEFIRDLTNVTLTLGQRDMSYTVMRTRDLLVLDFDIGSATSEFSKLLSDRQVHGSRDVQKHSLLLYHLSWLYKGDEGNSLLDKSIVSENGYYSYLDDYISDSTSSSDPDSLVDMDTTDDDW